MSLAPPAKSSVIAVLPFTLDELVLTGPGPRRDWRLPSQVTRTMHEPSTQFDAVELGDELVAGGAADVAVGAEPAERGTVLVPAGPDAAGGAAGAAPEARGAVPVAVELERDVAVSAAAGPFDGASAPQPSAATAARTPMAAAAGRTRVRFGADAVGRAAPAGVARRWGACGCGAAAITPRS